jgi:hypothetical protein
MNCHCLWPVLDAPPPTDLVPVGLDMFVFLTGTDRYPASERDCPAMEQGQSIEIATCVVPFSVDDGRRKTKKKRRKD